MSEFLQNKPCRTKIVATVGPASNTEEMLESLVKAGVDVFRLNFAHGGPEQNAPILARIRKVSEKMGQPIAVLADLAGPKMRLGELPGGEYFCENGATVRFIRGTTSEEPGVFTTTYEPLIDDLHPGDRILLADGTVVLQVEGKDANSAVCRVVQSGKVRSRQGVNLPGVALSIKTIQPHDIENAIWATQAGIDFLGLSFVRSPDDIVELRGIISKAASEKFSPEQWSAMTPEERAIHYPNIIAKIEKPEVLDCLDEVVIVSDGVMVARGDLGVESDIARIAVIQKRIIETCHRYIKPVIVATQMLESMTEETLPTRAEATDVANAILDGADACMLSGESAVGKHPVLAVEMMNRIAKETESLFLADRKETQNREFHAHLEVPDEEVLPENVRISIAVCDAAGQLADRINAAMILIATKTGRTALNFSNMRNFVMTVGTSDSDAVLRRLCLYWGVFPIGGIPKSPVAMLEMIVKLGRDGGYLQTGDRIVLTAGIGAGDDARNAIYVHVVGS